MSEQTKHNNRAVWGDRWEPGTYAAPLGTYAISFGQRFESGSGDRWNQSLTICEAKGLCSALSDALGVELHPAGTADRLQRADERVRELEAQVREDAVWRDAAIVELRKRSLNSAAAIDGCRVTAETDPDPAIPEGLSDEVLGELIRMVSRERDGETATYILPAYRDALVGGGLVGETESSGYYRITPTGRALAAHLVANMRRKVEPLPSGIDCRDASALLWALAAERNGRTALPDMSDLGHRLIIRGWSTSDEHQRAPLNETGRALAILLDARIGLQEKTATEPEQWSEPVDGMTWERCARLCSAMGSTLRTQHAEKGWKAIVGDIYVPDGGYWETEDRASMAAVRWCADNASRYDAATDRVRLTGLEVPRG